MDNNRLEHYDLYYELEGLKKFKERPVPDFYRANRSKTRSLETLDISRSFGHMLIKACPRDTLRRYDTLYDFESQTRPSHDYGFLIGFACQIIESEISRLLAEPAREVGEIMMKHLELKNKKKPLEFMERWLENRIPTMIGVASFVLMALRYALDKKDEQAIEFVARHFRGKYPLLLSANKLGNSLDKIKNNFRNPACHGTKAFDLEDYQNFILLSLGATNVREWDRCGPKYDVKIQEYAVFHNHLTLSKAMPEIVVDQKTTIKEKDERFKIITMFRRLVRMASPDLNCHLDVHPSNTVRSISRDMTFNDTSINKIFSLNSRINIGYYYNGLQKSVEVTLFDVGTTGKLTVLMPDDILSEGTINWFPDVKRNQSLTLTGTTGIETLFAIVTQKELDLRQRLQIDKTMTAKKFIGEDAVQLMSKLINIIEIFPTAAWTISEFEFEII